MRLLYGACLVASPIFLLSYASMMGTFMTTHPVWMGLTVLIAHVLQLVAFGLLLDSRSAQRRRQ